MTICKSKSCSLRWLQNCGDVTAVLWRAPLELLGTAPDVCVVIAVPWIRFWGLERHLWSFRNVWCLCHSDEMRYSCICSLVSLLIFRKQVDLPSNRRCDLRHGRLHSVWWKPCGDELVSERGWRCHVPGHGFGALGWVNVV